MAPKRAPKSPIPRPARPGQAAPPGKPQPKGVQPQPQHKPWSTSVKSGGRGH